jgi:alanine dehydrogenase
MPGAVSHTSTWALTNTTINYAVSIANKGIVAAAKADRAVMLGINTYGGGVTYGPVAAAHKVDHLPIETALG